MRLQQLVKEAEFLSGASTTVDLVPSPAEDFLSISRERRLMQMFSSRLRKESTTPILFSPYLQSLGLVLVQWQRLREAMGLGCELDETETNDAADDGTPRHHRTRCRQIRTFLVASVGRTWFSWSKKSATPL